MTTRLLRPEDVEEAAELLRTGNNVAFPTETVYGLGARVFNEKAVQAIFTAKGRPSDNPLIVHCAEKRDMMLVAEPLPLSRQRLFDALFAAFCPGPLTILLPKRSAVPSVVTAGLPTVAVRFPHHPLAQALIQAVGEPLVAPSANRSGYPSPTSAQHVLQDLEGRIAAVIDGGECIIGIESTVVNILDDTPTILRPGSITSEELDMVAVQCGFPPFRAASLIHSDLIRADSTHSETIESAPLSPGMKYRHYAPNAQVLVVATPDEAAAAAQKYAPAMILAREEILSHENILAQRALLEHPTTVAHILSQQSLYAALRRADNEQLHTVIILADDPIQRDAALMNRITKAASGR